MERMVETLACLARHEDYQADMRAFFIQAIPALFDLARSLQTRKKLDEAVTMLKFILDGQPGHPDARQCLADIYLEKRDIIASLQQYDEMKRRGQALDAEKFKQVLFSAVHEQHQLIAAESFDLAIRLTELVGSVQSSMSVAAILSNLKTQRFLANIRLADQYHQALDAKKELACRIAIWQDPLDQTRPTVYRLQNLYHAVGGIFFDQVAPGHIQLARAMVASVATMPHHQETGPLSQEAIFERYYRELFERIDLDLVTGPPLKKFHQPGGQLVSSTGQFVTEADVHHKIKELGSEVLFYTGSSQGYAGRYLQSYLKSILKNCDCRFFIIVELVLHDPGNLEFIQRVGIQDERIVYWLSPFDPAYENNGVLRPNHEELGHPSSYYAFMLLLRMSHLLDMCQLPTIFSGIDTILQYGLRDFLDRLEPYDFVLNNSAAPSLAGQVIMSLMFVRPTYHGRIFANFMGHVAWNMLQRNIQAHAQEQMYLSFAKHHVTINGYGARIGHFAEYDTNNIMFTRHNIEHGKSIFEKYRFVNVYSSGVLEGNQIFVDKIVASNQTDEPGELFA